MSNVRSVDTRLETSCSDVLDGKGKDPALLRACELAPAARRAKDEGRILDEATT